MVGTRRGADARTRVAAYAQRPASAPLLAPRAAMFARGEGGVWARRDARGTGAHRGPPPDKSGNWRRVRSPDSGGRTSVDERLPVPERATGQVESEDGRPGRALRGARISKDDHTTQDPRERGGRIRRDRRAHPHRALPGRHRRRARRDVHEAPGRLPRMRLCWDRVMRPSQGATGRTTVTSAIDPRPSRAESLAAA